MIFTMVQQPLDPLAYHHWYKQKSFFLWKMHKLILKILWEKKIKTHVIMLWKFKSQLKKDGVMKMMELITSSVKKISPEDYQKTKRVC